MKEDRVYRILVVEDEAAIADTIVYALESEHFQATVCDTGDKALSLFQSDEFQMVILDVGLPDMSGFDVCKRLRQLSDLPILILTARSEEIDRIVGFEIGADDYVTKPFSPRELVARVKAILRRMQLNAGSPSVSKEAIFSVDESACAISYCGEPLALTRYEYGLLRLLVSHPNRVYSREQIMNTVWSEPEECLDRTVDTHIKTVREKLRRVNPDLEPIKTRRGLGYCYQP